MKRLAVIILLAGCTAKEEKPGLYMITRTQVNQEVKDSTWVHSAPYFETTLVDYATNEKPATRLKAITREQEFKQNEYLKTTWQIVADSLGNELHFTSSTDFLNYMSARGFEMVDQTKRKGGTHYTFKRPAQ